MSFKRRIFYSRWVGTLVAIASPYTVSMRGASRRGSDPADVSLQSFAWPRATMATLCHSTLPWSESAPAASPLSHLRSLGARDRLSLTGQFAAHLALLQFARIADGEFDAAEWAV